ERGVGLAGPDVVGVEAAVVTDRLGEGFDAGVGRAGEAAAPGFLAHTGRGCRPREAPCVMLRRGGPARNGRLGSALPRSGPVEFSGPARLLSASGKTQGRGAGAGGA